MLAATHEAALAMVDDLQHVRTILAKQEPTPGDIRRMSNILRRLLIDNNGDLRKIAPPRIGPLRILAPDVTPFIRSGEKTPWVFWSAGLIDIFGLNVGSVVLERGSTARGVEDYDPEKTILLKQDGFLAQKVMSFQGQWASRSDTIKYIANVASGVHSSDPKEMSHELLNAVRFGFTIKMDEIVLISFNPDAIRVGSRPITVDRSAMDCVLLQLMAAARFLTLSPDIIRLEEYITSENPLGERAGV